MRRQILLAAISSNSKRCTCSNYYHICVAFRGGKILAYGYNCCCSSTKKYGHVDSVHAEIKMLEGMKKTKRSFDILVIRINKSGTGLLDSQPCRRCENWIRNYPVNRIYYSKSDGTICYMFQKQIPKVFKMKNKYRNVKSWKTSINVGLCINHL